MKKEIILKFLNKCKEHKFFYKESSIQFINYGSDNKRKAIEIEIEDDYINLVFGIQDNLFFDLMKDIKLKDFININKLKVIKESYLNNVLEELYQTNCIEKFKDYLLIFISNSPKEDIDFNKLTNKKKCEFLILTSGNYFFPYILKKKHKDNYFINLLENTDTSELPDHEKESYLKCNLNLAKKVIKENLDKKNIVNYLENNKLNKLIHLIDRDIGYYKYVEKEENRKSMFESIMKNHIKDIYSSLSDLKKTNLINIQFIEILEDIIVRQIKDNKTDYIEKLSGCIQSFAVQNIYNKKEELNAYDYLISLTQKIDFNTLKDIDMVKEYVSIQINLREF